jgi:hypothetical protein
MIDRSFSGAPQAAGSTLQWSPLAGAAVMTRPAPSFFRNAIEVLIPPQQQLLANDDW